MMQDVGSNQNEQQKLRKTQIFQFFCQMRDQRRVTQVNQRVTDKEKKS